MFTGLIEETGRVVRITQGSGGSKIIVRGKKTLDGTRVGDSVAVNGVCLTVTAIRGNDLAFDAMPETLEKSALPTLHASDAVNLERAIAAGDRLGGHFVSGHVDGTGVITSILRDGIARVFRIGAAQDVMRWILPKGSVSIDGVSLTICTVSGTSFAVSVIPHTAANTTLASLKPGDRVNVECDMAAKRNWADADREASSPQEKKIDISFLRTHGFLED
jgi:riboflavin synthase